jgi:type I restriction enzyme S subunit
VRDGWQTKTLGEVCEFQRGLTYSKGDEVDLSGNVVLRAMNIDLASHRLDFSDLKYISDEVVIPESKKVRRGSLLVCTASGSKSHLGKIAYIDDDYGYAFGGFMGMLVPSSELVPTYLFYVMTSGAYEDFIAALADGMNINNLKYDVLKKFRVLYPSLPEQKRIVGILDEAFEGIATAKANAEKNHEHACALFKSDLRSIVAEAWKAGELVTLSSLATDITDGDHMPPPKALTGVPFITIRNVMKDTGEIDFSETFMVPREYFEGLKDNKKPRKGDVLYTVTGSFGIPVLVERDVEFCFQRHIALVRPKPETDSAWLYYLLMSPQVFDQADERATGTAQRTVSLGVLRSLAVPAVPLPRQRAAAARLEMLTQESQRLVVIYERKLAALDELKQSLLHQAFSGRL